MSFKDGFISILPLYYNLDDNCITDEFGHIIYNPYRYITPNDLLLFKNGRDPVAYIPSQRNDEELIELVSI